MAYDFTTDIKNLTGMTTIDSSLIAWAVDEAKTFYIADDPANYDEDLSMVDNKLVAMLAAGFITLQQFGTFTGTMFKLDELSIDSSKSTYNERKFFNMFFDWLNRYLGRGILLQYVESAGIIAATEYIPEIYLVDRDLPEGNLTGG